MGVVVVSWWPLPDVLGEGAGASVRPATVTVVESARCGAPTARDRVAVTIDGRRMEVPFNGCGHREGRRLEVLVPADPRGDFVAQPAVGDTADTDTGDLRGRLTWVLVTLAAVAGGGYSLLLRPRPRH